MVPRPLRTRSYCDSVRAAAMGARASSPYIVATWRNSNHCARDVNIELLVSKKQYITKRISGELTTCSSARRLSCLHRPTLHRFTEREPGVEQWKPSSRMVRQIPPVRNSCLYRQRGNGSSMLREANLVVVIARF